MDFWWGTGASSTQTEGAAPASDWYAWERSSRAPRSGSGNGFANRYADDFALLARHGLSHHRLSLEWARLEPRNGERDPLAIEHYREVLRAARDAGVAVWACLHHFTLPGWFSHDERGFLDERSRTYYWHRHVDFVAETFGDLVFGWKPVNEPAAYAFTGWLGGGFPPGEHDLDRFSLALESTHLAAFEAALRLRGGGRPVATIQNLSPVRAVGGTPEAAAYARVVDDVLWGCWASALRDGELRVPGRGPVVRPAFRDAFDLVGFSYYNALGVTGDGTFVPWPSGKPLVALGYAPWAEGLGEVLDRLATELPDHPLLVAEYGLGTTDDAWRCEYLRDGLAQLAAARAGGVDVRGFFHWTAVDNYEWLHGFDVPFGLFDRDRAPRPSAAVLRDAATG